jgi:hypothetical protein
MREQGFRPDDFEIIQHADPSPAFPSAWVWLTSQVAMLGS